MTSPEQLLDSLRKLLSIAERAGADPAWVRATVDGIVELVLAQRIDARHERTLAIAQQMASVVTAMRQQGYTPGQRLEALRRRYGKSRSRVYALLAMGMSRKHAGHFER
jgi:hypothetical protein